MDAVNHLKKHLSKSYLEQLRNIALSAAGFSAGLLVLLAQSGGAAPNSKVALWSALCALLVSLYGWQYVLPFIAFGEETYKRFNVFVIALIQVVAVIALHISICAILWSLSACASLFLAVFGVVLAVLVLRHNIQIMKFSYDADA